MGETHLERACPVHVLSVFLFQMFLADKISAEIQL